MEIFVRGSITKEQIPAVGAMRGCVSSKPVCCNGTTYAAGAIMFVEHDGVWDKKTRLFTADFVFTTDTVKDAPTADLNGLFTHGKPTTKKAKVTDGTVNDVR